MENYSYGQYSAKIVDKLLEYFKCNIDIVRGYSVDGKNQIIVELLDYNGVKICIDLYVDYAKILDKNYGHVEDVDVFKSTEHYINMIEQEYLNYTIRRK